MGPDYAGSTGKLWAFCQEFEKSGGKIVQTILWPIGEMDLAPYFARISLLRVIRSCQARVNNQLKRFNFNSHPKSCLSTNQCIDMTRGD
jgi:hypothetical protein